MTSVPAHPFVTQVHAMVRLALMNQGYTIEPAPPLQGADLVAVKPGEPAFAIGFTPASHDAGPTEGAHIPATLDHSDTVLYQVDVQTDPERVTVDEPLRTRLRGALARLDAYL